MPKIIKIQCSLTKLLQHQKLTGCQLWCTKLDGNFKYL